MNLILQGARVIDPSQNLDAVADIRIEDGLIAEMAPKLAVGAKAKKGGDTTILPLKGLVVVPGLIDMHVHLREPGYEYKETIATGCDAAAAGGFTAVACMPNTDPVNDSRAVTEYIRRKAAEANGVRVYPVAALSAGSDGKALSEFWDLKDAGAAALSDDGKPLPDGALMRRALEYAASLDLPVLSHCEDKALVGGGVMNEGAVSTELGLRGIPAAAEEIIVAREILLADYTRTAVHICHVSTAGSVRLIREAKARGVRITAETAPHYFTLTDAFLRTFDVNGKVNPPLRSEADVAAVKAGLADGALDAIATDHAPHAQTDKEVEFDYAANGMIGLETSLGLSLKLVEEGVLTLPELIARMSTTPAAILRVPGGSLRAGAAADITVIDLNRTWTVDPAAFRSKSRNCPFAGWTLKGKAVLTLVGGRTVYSDLA